MQAPLLPSSFLNSPIAHRALHGMQEHCPENSRAAIRAAIAAGYGIEIDLQLSADGQAMVFHDDDLDRLTEASGPVRARSAAELAAIPLKNSAGEGIPTFAEVLEIVAGQVPLLVEIKDQDGAMGPEVGPLEAAAVAALEGYAGPVALMSFNPYSMAEVARLAPDIPGASPPAPMIQRPGRRCRRPAARSCARSRTLIGSGQVSSATRRWMPPDPGFRRCGRPACSFSAGR